jgi:hypothetical protein
MVHGAQEAHRKSLRNMGSNRWPELAKLIEELGRCRTHSELGRCLYQKGLKVFDAEDGTNGQCPYLSLVELHID